MYLLTKFQLRIQKAKLYVQPHKAAIERSICKLQALTKTDVTYKWSDTQTRLCVCAMN